MEMTHILLIWEGWSASGGRGVQTTEEADLADLGWGPKHSALRNARFQRDIFELTDGSRLQAKQFKGEKRGFLKEETSTGFYFSGTFHKIDTARRLRQDRTHGELLHAEAASKVPPHEGAAYNSQKEDQAGSRRLFVHSELIGQESAQQQTVCNSWSAPHSWLTGKNLINHFC